MIYLNGGNDGLNCFVPTSAPEFAKYQTLRPTIARALGAGVGAAGRHDDHARNGQHARVLEQARLGHRGRPERRRHRLRHALRRRHGRRRIGSRDHPGGRLQPAQPIALREPRLLVRRCALAAADGVARPLARRLRLDVNPLQAVSLDSNLSKQIRSAKAPVCALEGLQGVGFSVPGVTGDVNSEVGKLATIPAGAGNDALGRSRGMWGLTVDVANRLDSHSARRPRAGLSAQQRPLAEAAAGGDPALGRSRHSCRHDRLGQLRHPRRPARRAGSAAHHALARPGRLQGRPDRSGRRAERRHDGLLRVRPPPRGVRLQGHRSRLGRPHHAQRLGRQGRARRRAPRRQRQPGRRPRRQDRLPHGLPVADRRVAGRRPERDPAGRPVPRHRTATTAARPCSRQPDQPAWLDARPCSPSWCSPSQRHREWRARPASARTGCTSRHPPRCPPCRSRSRSTSSNGACAAPISRSRPDACRSTSITAAWTITTSPLVDAQGVLHTVPLASGADAVLDVDVRGGPGAALLLAVRRHPRLPRGQGHGLRRHSEVIATLDVDLQRRECLELLAPPCQQRLVRPAGVGRGEHPERLQQQRPAGARARRGQPARARPRSAADARPRARRPAATRAARGGRRRARGRVDPCPRA